MHFSMAWLKAALHSGAVPGRSIFTASGKHCFGFLGRTYFPRGSACNPFSWLVQLANWALFHM